MSSGPYYSNMEGAEAYPEDEQSAPSPQIPSLSIPARFHGHIGAGPIQNGFSQYPQAQTDAYGAQNATYQQPATPPSGDHESEDGRRKIGKPSKVTRACDPCRRKKIKCLEGDAESGKPCGPCAKDGPNAGCTYLRDPQKRGPNKGYITDLKDQLDKVSEEGVYTRLHLVDYSRGSAHYFRDIERELLENRRLIKQALGDRLPNNQLDDEEDFQARKRQRLSCLSGVQNALSLRLSDQVAYTRYTSSSLKTTCPLLPLKFGDFEKILTEHSTVEARKALFLSLNAVFEEHDREQVFINAITAIKEAKEGSLIRLQAIILLIIARQAYGPLDNEELSVKVLLRRACDEHNGLGLRILTPSGTPNAFQDGAPNIEYSRLGRMTSLTLRTLLVFHALGTGEVLPTVKNIELPGQGDVGFLDPHTVTFFDFADVVMAFVENPAAGNLEASFAKSRRYLSPEYHGLVDCVELAYARVHARTQPNFIDIILEESTSLADKVYANTDDGNFKVASTHYYFHPLALTFKTLLDLSKVDGDDNAPVRAAANQKVAELAVKASNVLKVKKSSWDRSAEAMLRLGPGDSRLVEQLDWPLITLDGTYAGYFDVLTRVS